MKVKIIFSNENDIFWFKRGLKRGLKVDRFSRIRVIENDDGVQEFEYELTFRPLDNYGGGQRKLTDAQVKEFQRLYESGVSKRDLMSLFNISYSSVNNYIRRIERRY